MKRPAPEHLAVIRQFEAAGFRAWPATAVHYDGTWAVRLTASHPSHRLNSVNPLDPSDDWRIEERIERLTRHFRAFGRPFTFRISPLAAPAVSAHLASQGWRKIKTTLVLRRALNERVFADAMHQIPLKDLDRFVTAAFQVHGYQDKLRPGFTEVISSIKPRAGLFILEQGNVPVSTAICVHDGRLAGLFEVATVEAERGKGFGKRMLLSALKWAYSHGAREAWLQVEQSNAAALNLYRSLGFEEVYRYHYRQPGSEA
ncbi:GNAT family N-acetyltransferase [Chelativorans sp. YIM 93263]|uniref:GNAT family N-acetyltransferase n=1 Tax=Chelativorans sp. YIM 93263 TaxID=2906648 RepID=UPI002377F705|nr:GNAT family N-acetyltransferase [Chelativorans sp. YIM 93263]